MDLLCTIWLNGIFSRAARDVKKKMEKKTAIIFVS